MKLDYFQRYYSKMFLMTTEKNNIFSHSELSNGIFLYDY